MEAQEGKMKPRYNRPFFISLDFVANKEERRMNNGLVLKNPLLVFFFFNNNKNRFF